MPVNTPEPHSGQQHLHPYPSADTGCPNQPAALQPSQPSSSPSTSTPRAPKQAQTSLRNLTVLPPAFFTIPPSSLLVSTLPASTSLVFPVLSIWFIFALRLPFPARRSPPSLQMSPPEGTSVETGGFAPQGSAAKNVSEGKGPAPIPTSGELAHLL